jgi:hypothetical protein
MTDIDKFLSANTFGCVRLHARISAGQCDINRTGGHIPQCADYPACRDAKSAVPGKDPNREKGEQAMSKAQTETPPRNKLKDLNDHLFAQLERLNAEDITDDVLTKEIQRTNAVSTLAKEIVSNASLMLKAQLAMGAAVERKLPPMLTE